MKPIVRRRLSLACFILTGVFAVAAVPLLFGKTLGYWSTYAFVSTYGGSLYAGTGLSGNPS